MVSNYITIKMNNERCNIFKTKSRFVNSDSMSQSLKQADDMVQYLCQNPIELSFPSLLLYFCSSCFGVQ